MKEARDSVIRVLLVEDSSVFAAAVAGMLSEANSNSIRIERADRLSAGLEALDAGGADVVLLDLDRTLDGEVSERTEELSRLLRRKNEFINQLAHDLGTPLTPLVSLLPIVERRVDDPELKEMLSTAVDSVDYMRRLIESTLQLARTNEAGASFRIEDAELRAEVGKILAGLKHTLDEVGVTAVNNVPAELAARMDRLRFHEVIDNLVTNAAKFMDAGGIVTVGASARGGEVEVSVADTGIGMTPEQLSHVFEEFYKADASRRDRASAGLGLSICKRIIEKLGGRIWAESPGPGCGTAMHFTLPPAAQTQYTIDNSPGAASGGFDGNSHQENESCTTG